MRIYWKQTSDDLIILLGHIPTLTVGNDGPLGYRGEQVREIVAEYPDRLVLDADREATMEDIEAALAWEAMAPIWPEPRVSSIQDVFNFLGGGWAGEWPGLVVRRSKTYAPASRRKR